MATVYTEREIISDIEEIMFPHAEVKDLSYGTDHKVVFFGHPCWSIFPDEFDFFLDSNFQLFTEEEIDEDLGDWTFTCAAQVGFQEAIEKLLMENATTEVIVRNHDFWGREELVEKFLSLPRTHLLGEFLNQ